jgi:hypothetical protein
MNGTVQCPLKIVDAVKMGTRSDMAMGRLEEGNREIDETAGGEAASDRRLHREISPQKPNHARNRYLLSS